jgi:hypothetical protein
MPFVLLLVAMLLIVPAVRGTVKQLGAALSQDVPAFGTWFMAMVAVGLLGVVPGLRGPSRMLVVLVLLVLFLTRYQAVVAGFKGALKTASISPAPATPATAYAASTNNLALLSPSSGGQAVASGAPASGGGNAIDLHAVAGLADLLGAFG